MTPARTGRGGVLARAGVGVGVAVVALAVAAAATFATRAAPEYRAAGLVLLDDAEAYRADSANPDAEEARPLSGPHAPAPVLIAALAIGSRGQDEDLVRAASRGGTLAVVAAAVLVALAAWRLVGAVGALGALAVFLLTPGTLYHARTLGPEATGMLAYAALIWAAVQGRPVVRGLAGAVALAFALGSSHESVVMVIVWGIAAAALAPREGAASLQGTLRLGRIEPADFVPILLAPALLFMVWPHLEADGLKSWIHFVSEPFRAHHPPYMIAGELYVQADAQGPGPLAGLLVFLTRVPLAVGILGGLGAVYATRAVADPERPARRALFAVLAVAALVLVFALNGSPYYAGLDGFALVVPMLAVLSGVGTAALWSALHAVWPRALRVPAGLGASAVVALLLGTVALELALVHPSEPMYYNALVGGPSGGIERGMESRYGIALPDDVLQWLNESLPRQAEVAFFPESDEHRHLLDRLMRRGLVRADIKSAAPYHATHLVVPRMPAYPQYQDARAWTAGPVVFEWWGARHFTVHTL